MSIIAFNFTKINAERKGVPGRASGIKANTGIKNVEETPIGSQKALKFTFAHIISYAPQLATIVLEGEVLVLSNDKEVKETLAEYKKNKTFNRSLTEKVYNAILSRANIEALLLSKELNLPAPFRLPHIAAKEGQEKPKQEPKKK